MSSLRFSYFIKIGILFLAYFITAKIGLSFDAVSGFATLVWPPSGIALAAILLFGYRLWPGIFLGAFLVNLITGAPFFAAIGMGTGNTLEPLLGAYLMRRFTGFKDTFLDLRQVLGFIFLAGFLSSLISATFGTSSLYFNGAIDISVYLKTWIAWWLGDVLGVLIFVPLIIYWSRWRNVYFSIRETAEALLMLFLLFIFCLIIFGEILGEPFIDPLLIFLLFLPLIWSALRFGFRMTIFCILSLSVISIIATMSGRGPFVRVSLAESLVFLQIFMAVISSTSLIITGIIDNLKQVKEELTKFNQELEIKVKKRANALIKSKEEQLRHEIQLEEKERDFVSMASHQLLTPIALIRGYLSMLLSGKYGNVDSIASGYLSESLKGAQRMAKLVKDLLTTSSIESGHIKIEKQGFDLTVVLLEVLKDFRSKAEQKHLKFIVNVRKESSSVLADIHYTREVLANIIDNAIKYTKKGGISFTVKKSANGFISISIEDTGIGINRNDIPHVFDRFYMSKNWLTRQSDSNGLGLYISRLLVEKMGGTITVESQVDKGSEFIINLPQV